MFTKKSLEEKHVIMFFFLTWQKNLTCQNVWKKNMFVMVRWKKILDLLTYAMY